MKLPFKLGLLALPVASFVSFAQAPVSDLASGSVDSRLEAIERIIKARNQAQLDMQQQLNSLQDEVNEMRGMTETHAYKLEQMLERQRELYQEIDRRMNAVNQAPAVNPLVTPQSAVTSVPVSESYSGTMTENDAYDKAVNLILRDKRYDQAIPEFETFLTNFPESSYAPNALYWLGQLYFNKDDYAKAKENFSRVVASYPDSNKRADAMFKLGMVSQKENAIAEAKRIFSQLIEEYPDSSSANLARTRLASM